LFGAFHLLDLFSFAAILREMVSKIEMMGKMVIGNEMERGGDRESREKIEIER
jgi:hypothetical protein